MIKDKTKKEEKDKQEEDVKLKGKYISCVGRRKSATAQVRLFDKGTGVILVNNKLVSEYFTEAQANDLIQPLKLSGFNKEFNISIKVTGGGKYGQAGAARQGITKALIIFNKDLRPALKAKGYTTRDSRIKERKKPGLKRARRAPQWSKR